MTSCLAEYIHRWLSVTSYKNVTEIHLYSLISHTYMPLPSAVRSNGNQIAKNSSSQFDLGQILVLNTFLQ